MLTNSVFARTLSRMPMHRSTVTPSTTAIAGTLTTIGIPNRCGAAARTSEVAFIGFVVSQSGGWTPMPRMSPVKYPAQPMATATLPTAYSSTRSHPMIHAMISPKDA